MLNDPAFPGAEAAPGHPRRREALNSLCSLLLQTPLSFRVARVPQPVARRPEAANSKQLPGIALF